MLTAIYKARRCNIQEYCSLNTEIV